MRHRAITKLKYEEVVVVTDMKLKNYFDVKWKDIIITLTIPLILMFIFGHFNYALLSVLMAGIFVLFFMMIAIGVFDNEFNIDRN